MTAPIHGFSGPHRRVLDEDELVLTTVGVDIGSATSHVMFSRLVMERHEDRYEIVSRERLAASRVFMTPFADPETIDGARLGEVIDAAFAEAGLDRGAIDTGSLLLTGLAARRANARVVGEVFAKESGRFVTVAAGDALESMLAAYGSGSVALSQSSESPLINVDIGGGTTKIALCHEGEIVSVTAVNVGARLVITDDFDQVLQVEPAGRQIAELAGVRLVPGERLSKDDAIALSTTMAAHILAAAVERTSIPSVLSLIPPIQGPDARQVVFSGGVSEYIYGHATGSYGDLGSELADAVLTAFAGAGMKVLHDRTVGIRATVVGASQYATQLSGSTVYIDPPTAIPLRNVAVIDPFSGASTQPLDAPELGRFIADAVALSGVDAAQQPIAVMVRWEGHVTFTSIDRISRALLIARDLASMTSQPLVVASDRDVAGLLGLHLREELSYTGPLVSVDGLALLSFDYIDIGQFVESSGAVPVAIKSLIFPPADQAVTPAAESVSRER